jgi:hypothetical protein
VSAASRVKPTSASSRALSTPELRCLLLWHQAAIIEPSPSSSSLADKGIKTSYLPCNTVTLKAVDSPQQTRFDGRVPGKFTGEYNYNFM